jgi:putative NADH-flavin reductase
MNIVIFGASRGVGHCLVESALAQGHQVTAAVRDPATVHSTHERLRVLPGDVLNPTLVQQAIAGQDVVFCTLGADSRRGPTTLYSAGVRNVLHGMEAHQVRRLIFLSNFGVLNETAQDVRGAALLWMAKRFLRHTLADHRRALEEVQGQSVEWIAVRPLALTNGLGTGRYRIAVDGLPVKGTRIARADVADFMIRQVTSDDYVYKVPAIAY